MSAASREDDASTEPAPEPSEPWGEAPTAGEAGIYKSHHGYERCKKPGKIELIQKGITARQSMLKVNPEHALFTFVQVAWGDAPEAAEVSWESPGETK